MRKKRTIPYKKRSTGIFFFLAKTLRRKERRLIIERVIKCRYRPVESEISLMVYFPESPKTDSAQKLAMPSKMGAIISAKFGKPLYGKGSVRKKRLTKINKK